MVPSVISPCHPWDELSRLTTLQAVNYRHSQRISISLGKVNLSRQSTKNTGEENLAWIEDFSHLGHTMNSQPQHLPSPEKTLRKKKRERKENWLIAISLMNGRISISILITQARLSVVFKITTKLNSNFSYYFWKEKLAPDFEAQSLSLLISLYISYLTKCLMKSFHQFVNCW